MRYAGLRGSCAAAQPHPALPGGIVAIVPMDHAAAIDAAYRALAAGCRFLIARGADAATVPAGVALRRGANCLNELDRMLAVLIAAGGWGQRAAGRTDVYVRAGDAAQQMYHATALRARFAPDLPRLRALARVRALASGELAVVAGSRPQHDLALALHGTAAPGAGFALDAAALAVIAGFYLTLGDRLLQLAKGAP